MRDQFAHFYTPDDDTIATAMKTGLVVPDANVLLNFYRFQRTARDELFDALEKLGDRLWIPHQVGLEFHQTRLVVMAEQDAYFDSAGEVIVARVKDYRCRGPRLSDSFLKLAARPRRPVRGDLLAAGLPVRALTGGAVPPGAGGSAIIGS